MGLSNPLAFIPLDMRFFQERRCKNDMLINATLYTNKLEL